MKPLLGIIQRLVAAERRAVLQGLALSVVVLVMGAALLGLAGLLIGWLVGRDMATAWRFAASLRSRRGDDEAVWDITRRGGRRVALSSAAGL